MLHVLMLLRLAATNGAKCLEFDVSFSSDVSGVAFHDTSDRVNMTSGQVNSLTYSQLAELDLATNNVKNQC